MSDWRNRNRWPSQPPSRKQAEGAARLLRGAYERLSPQDATQDGVDEEKAVSRLQGAVKTAKRAALPVSEAVEQQRLAIWALSQWWAPGFRSHEQARAGWRQGEDARRRGQRPGWPDVTVHVPEIPGAYPKLLALELKRATARPAGVLEGAWWLDWLRSDSTAQTRHGLTRAQAQTLRDLAGCGYRCVVCYGAEDATAWLDARIGPRPDALPEGWCG